MDDGSACGVANRLRTACTDTRITITENMGVSGAGGARNFGLLKAHGEFITFIDSDDSWVPNFLEESLKFLTENSYSSCYSSYRRYLVDKGVFIKDFVPARGTLSADDILGGCDISCLTFFGKWNSFTPIFFGEIRARNDLVFFVNHLRLFGISHRLDFLSGTYNIRSNSISASKLRLIKYQYLVNRIYGQKSIYHSVINLLRWINYGYQKYR